MVVSSAQTRHIFKNKNEDVRLMDNLIELNYVDVL